jgi:hypothetical protein
MSNNPAMHREAFDLMCGDRLGYGMSRTVYACKLLPDCVVKVEEDSGRFQNVVEWETWQRVRDTPASRWFAACRWISPNGSVLVMERTRPPAPSEFLDRMPAFLCDFKRTNYGMAKAEGRHGKPETEWLVCHDYGTHLMFEHGMTKRLRKADWWDA